MESDNIFNLYKPLRNHLRKLSIPQSMYVIWAFSQHFVFNNAIPKDIQTIPEFDNTKSWIEKKFFPWELEILIREILINGKMTDYSEKTLKKWSYLSGSLNKLKNFQNDLSRIYSTKRNVLVELFRISHSQFPWQEGDDLDQIIRYYKIFSTHELNLILQDKTGLSVNNLYHIGMLFTGAYIKHPAINLPINVQTKTITNEKVDIFTNLFCIDASKLKQQLIDEQEFNEKFVYSFSPLKLFPLVKTIYLGKESIMCPLPKLLFWRITSGIYYDIYNEKKFGNHFGASFEKYVGEVCEKAKTNTSIKIIKESTYKIGKKQKHTTDWMVEDQEAILFIECKTKRIPRLAKEEVLDEHPIKKELEMMSDFIFQVYKSIYDYEQNLYPNIKYSKGKKVFPIILTLESWFAFGDYSLNIINKFLIDKFKTNNLPINYLSDMPYSIVSIKEFEKMSQIIQKKGIKDFMENKVLGENNKWAMSSYMNNQHKDLLNKTNSLFKDEFDELFSIKN